MSHATRLAGMASGSGLGVAAIVLAAMLWGSTGTVQALLPPERVPVVVGALRTVVGALSLIALALIAPRARAGLSALPHGLTLAAGVAMAAYNLSFFAAVADIGVGIGTALAVGSAPLWASVFVFFVQRHAPSRQLLLGQAICIAGATLLVATDAGGTASPFGIAMALTAGASYAGYSLLVSMIGARLPSITVAAGTFTVAALVVVPVLIFSDARLGALATPRAIALIAALGLFSTGLAYVLYTWGLRSVTPSVAVTLALAEPLTAWILATFVIGEPLTALKVTGALVLLVGLWFVTRSMNDNPGPQ